MPINPFSTAQNVYAVIRIRRGPESDREQFVYDDGELIYSTDKKRLFIGDGVNNIGTYGGNVVANKTWIVDSFDKLPYIQKNDLVYRTDSGNCGFYVLTGDSYLLPTSYLLIGGKRLINDNVFIPPTYVLPFCSKSDLGGLVAGDGLAVDQGVVSIDFDNSKLNIVSSKLTVTDGINDLIPKASYTEYGKIKINTENALTISNGSLGINYDPNTLKLTPDNELAVADSLLVETPLATNIQYGKVKIVPHSGLEIINGNLRINCDSVTIGVNSNNELTYLGGAGTGGGGGGVLPTATDTRLGGVKIGDNITVAGDGTISVGDTVFIKQPTVATADQILTYNGSTATWVASGRGSFIPKPTINLTNGYILTYSTATNTWVSSAAPTGGTSTPEDLIPIGSVMYYASDAIPTGYLECDGSTKTIASYPDLNAVIGTKFNNGSEAAGTFRLPDLRGEFIRGWDNGRGVDAGRTFGSWQKGTLFGHDNTSTTYGVVGVVYTGGDVSRTITLPAVGLDNYNIVDYPNIQLGSSASIGNTTALPQFAGNAGSSGTTRPRNVALTPCIKAVKVAVTVTALNFIEKPASPTDGQSLVYSTAQSKWIPGAPAGGGGDAPVGTVTYFAAITPPTGYLECNGASVSRSVYADLFAVVGTTFNTGTVAATNFLLPDLRGEFVRGWDHGKGTDAGRAFGSRQTDDFKAHTHEYLSKGADNPAYNAWNGFGGTGMRPIATSSTGGTETRPRNVALLPCIKALKTGTPSVINYIEKPAATNGQILKFNGGTNVWEAGAAPATEGTFGTLASTTGYTSLPNGIIMQWGRFSTGMGSNSVNVNVTFPKAFPNACFSFVASIGVAITDYDLLAQYRTNKQSVSYGIPNKTGVEGQAFIDTLTGDDRVIQWHAYGN